MRYLEVENLATGLEIENLVDCEGGEGQQEGGGMGPQTEGGGRARGQAVQHPHLARRTGLMRLGSGEGRGAGAEAGTDQVGYVVHKVKGGQAQLYVLAAMPDHLHFHIQLLLLSSLLPA